MLIHFLVIDTVMLSIQKGTILEAGRPLWNFSSPPAGVTLGSYTLSGTATWLRGFAYAPRSVLRQDAEKGSGV